MKKVKLDGWFKPLHTRLQKGGSGSCGGETLRKKGGTEIGVAGGILEG